MADSGVDPRVSGLSVAVNRLRAELDAYPAQLRDRYAAEEELDVLEEQVADGAPVPTELRQSLLLLVAAVGSVSALSEPMTELRKAIELFGDPSEFRRVN
ncbi:DUF5955 family protein [Streptomyces albidus (ex Kaewkla and Franco 2022)]|uniref:DUF5955 family protein n=1 Tax=Streptomyces albidus (ex Kaewkla and Franco 2022) TaxID=722709 RepID=UPI002815BAC5|nr:DUF5955 family protein [Streptomyces albidus (ex Kaewkla and Franco 2022)]